MNNNLLALKIKKPYVGAFLEEWLAEYGNRDFDLTDPKDQDAFSEAVEKMTKHVMHASSSARLSVIFDHEDGIKTLFTHVQGSGAYPEAAGASSPK